MAPPVARIEMMADQGMEDMSITLANLRAALLTESNKRAEAEVRASRLESKPMSCSELLPKGCGPSHSHDVGSDQVQAQRALEVANKYTPIPRPRMSKNTT